MQVDIRWSDKTPYQRGFNAGLKGGHTPPFSTPNSSWADRLYERGWSAGVDARKAASLSLHAEPKA